MSRVRPSLLQAVAAAIGGVPPAAAGTGGAASALHAGSGPSRALHAAGSAGEQQADVIVVGAGHNGLVAATLLARQGLRVEVYEDKEMVGGACKTEYPFAKAPGLPQSTGALGAAGGAGIGSRAGRRRSTPLLSARRALHPA